MEFYNNHNKNKNKKTLVCYNNKKLEVLKMSRVSVAEYRESYENMCRMNKMYQFKVGFDDKSKWLIDGERMVGRYVLYESNKATKEDRIEFYKNVSNLIENMLGAVEHIRMVLEVSGYKQRAGKCGHYDSLNFFEEKANGYRKILDLKKNRASEKHFDLDAG